MTDRQRQSRCSRQGLRRAASEQGPRRKSRVGQRGKASISLLEMPSGRRRCCLFACLLSEGIRRARLGLIWRSSASSASVRSGFPPVTHTYIYNTPTPTAVKHRLNVVASRVSLCVCCALDRESRTLGNGWEGQRSAFLTPSIGTQSSVCGSSLNSEALVAKLLALSDMAPPPPPPPHTLARPGERIETTWRAWCVEAAWRGRRFRGGHA